MATKKMTYQRFMALSDADKEAVVAEFENSADRSAFKPPTPAQRKRWEKSVRETKKLRRGRPAVGGGARQIAVTMEVGLLKRVDRYAKAHDLKRAQLIARSLETFMGRAG